MGARGTVMALALVAMLLAGCGDDPDLDDDAAWRTSTDSVDTDGLVWASGSTVHLGDGTSIDTGGPIRAYLVAGDGVFFVPAESEEDSLQFSGADLFFAAPGAEAVDTGLRVADDGIAVSPDGSRLAILDADYDDGSAVMRLFDLSSGEAFTSEDGMDTSEYGDPVNHLLESEVEILGITDEEVHARVIQGDWVYDPATGEGRRAGEDEDPPGFGVDPLESPDGLWRIEKPDTGPDRVVDSNGDEVELMLEEPRSRLSWWADEETVVGTALTGPGRGKKTRPDDAVTLVSCVVPTGECTTHPDSTGQHVVFPTGASEMLGMYLQGGSE